MGQLITAPLNPGAFRARIIKEDNMIKKDRNLQTVFPQVVYPGTSLLPDSSSLFGPVETVFDQLVNHFFDGFPGPIKTAAGSSRAYPKTDIFREGSDIVIQAFVPFAKKEDLQVKLEEGCLTISGEGESFDETKNRGYLIKELRRSRFSRSFSVSKAVQDIISDVEAELKDGILTVVLKDAAKESKPPEKNIKVVDIKS